MQFSAILCLTTCDCHCHKYMTVIYVMSKPGFCNSNNLLSSDIIETKCDFSFHMIYYLCFYALSGQSYADQKKLF